MSHCALNGKWRWAGGAALALSLVIWRGVERDHLVLWQGPCYHYLNGSSHVDFRGYDEQENWIKVERM